MATADLKAGIVAVVALFLLVFSFVIFFGRLIDHL